MRSAGRVAVAGAVLMLAAGCRDDGRSASTAAPSGPTATSAVAVAARADATTATGPATSVAPRASFSEDLGAIAGTATTFSYPGSPISADVARCIGDGLVHVFGRAKVEQLGFGIGRWTLLGFSLALGPWNRADSTAVVDTFRVCTPDWELLMITSATSSAEHLDALASRCVADALDDTRAHDVFITLLDRPDDGALAPAVDDLRQAYAACLTPAQLASLALQDHG